MAANEVLQRANKDLQAENDRLREELKEIGDALGRLTGGPAGGRRGRRGAALEPQAAPPRRQRKPITDPEVLERRRQALARARAARAERLAAARASREAAVAAESQ